MKCSIVVCTYNRAESLRATLINIIQQEYEDLEIIVVDNNSQDHTREVVASLSSSVYPIKYYVESRQGLSYARNLGVDEASGEIVLFLDDDAIPLKKDWVERIASVYHDSEVGVAGGDLLPVWPEADEEPKWLPKSLRSPLGLTNFSYQETTTLSYPTYPWGANISFRKKDILALGGFCTELGRVGYNLLGGEETDLCMRLEKAGKKILYVPEAEVQHFISKEKLVYDSFSERAIFQGITDAVLETRHNNCFRIMIKLLRRSGRYPLYFLGWLFSCCFRNKKWILRCKFQMNISWSYVFYLAGWRIKNLE